MKPAIKIAGIFRPDRGDDEADAGRQCVSGRDRRNAKYRTGEGADFARCQSLGNQSGGLLGDFEFVVRFAHGKSAALS